tara:strand:+ start:134 stop:763 length:630 start_codon:yes stop_codon:yes gene_type:complete
MKLYEHPDSGNSHKVRLLFAFLDIPYDSIKVDLFEQEQNSAPFLEINPRGEVPVLDDGGIVLRDSMAILVHLATNYDSKRIWLPEDTEAYGAVMEWLAFSASWIQYGVFTARAAVAFGTMGNGLGWDFPVDPKEGQARGKKSLEILDKHLSSRKWLVGSYCTIADIACFPYVALAPMGDISLEPFRFVREWIGRFKELPNFITMPGLEI